MFSLAIFTKTLRDSMGSLVISALGMVAFVVLFVWAMLNMGAELLSFVTQFPFIRKIVEMGFGINMSGDVSTTILLAVCYTHGAVLVLAWSVIIATATRVTAGEVERGTADMLLTLPVSRWQVYISTSWAWVLSAAVLAICPIIGIGIALQIFETEEPVAISRFVAPAVNFFCLNIAVGGITSLVGSCLNRRGLAVGATVGMLVTSIVLNFLEPFLEVIKQIRFLSLLSYFRPVDIVRLGEWPYWQMGILLGLGAFCWTIGMIIFSSKDIPTA